MKNVTSNNGNIILLLVRIVSFCILVTDSLPCDIGDLKINVARSTLNIIWPQFSNSKWQSRIAFPIALVVAFSRVILMVRCELMTH